MTFREGLGFHRWINATGVTTQARIIATQASTGIGRTKCNNANHNSGEANESKAMAISRMKVPFH